MGKKKLRISQRQFRNEKEQQIKKKKSLKIMQTSLM